MQHEITKDHAEWLYSDKCNFKYFITATIPEDKMIREDYGYSKGVVQLTGFPRYDALNLSETKTNRVLIKPTWRYWFNLKSKGGEDVKGDFLHSDYLKNWFDLLNDKRLNEFVEKHDLEIIFFLHRNMQRYIDAFNGVNKHSILKLDIQLGDRIDEQNVC